MKPVTLLVSLLLTFYSTIQTYADSPLTSTDLYLAYQDKPIIVKALGKHGKLTIDLMVFLLSETNPIDEKIAVINALGWSIDGKSNSEKFVKYLKKVKGYSSEAYLFDNGNSDELLCLGYLKAMDNYFEVNDAIRFSEQALKLNPTSFTYAIIHALIKAQNELDNDWCQAFKTTDAVRNDISLLLDMEYSAYTLIFDYMENYRDTCEGFDENK